MRNNNFHSEKMKEYEGIQKKTAHENTPTKGMGDQLKDIPYFVLFVIQCKDIAIRLNAVQRFFFFLKRRFEYQREINTFSILHGGKTSVT